MPHWWSLTSLATHLGAKLIPITVHVREGRVEEFYLRFAEFISDVPDPAAPTRLPSGTVPSWVLTDEATAISQRLWDEISLPGHAVLLYLIRAAHDQTAYFRPEELAEAAEHPKGKSGIAGILGGVGKAIRRAHLPVYRTPSGRTWHYVWDWDGERYSMTPEVARLLLAAHRR